MREDNALAAEDRFGFSNARHLHIAPLALGHRRGQPNTHPKCHKRPRLQAAELRRTA